MDRYYKLNERNESIECSFTEYIDWIYENPHRINLGHAKFGKFEISTVFIGRSRKIFETLVWKGVVEWERKIYQTWSEALLSHDRLVEVYKKMDVREFIHTARCGHCQKDTEHEYRAVGNVIRECMECHWWAKAPEFEIYNEPN